MAEDPIPRMLPERTGKSRCTRCLNEVDLDEFLANDHLCLACAGDEEYPLRSTPGDSATPKKDDR